MHRQITARRNFLKKRASPLTIGFTAIADFSSFIGQEYLAGIMRASENYGVNFINMTSAIRPSLFVDKSFFSQYLAKIPFMRSPLLDGLVTWASSLSGYMKNEEIQNLFASLSPLPLVDIGYLDIPNVPSIRIDNDYSIHLLVEHLVKVHGFSKIAFFGSKFSLPHRLRLESFKKAMSDFGLEANDDLIFLADSLDAQDVAEQVERFIHLFEQSCRHSERSCEEQKVNNGGFDKLNHRHPQAILTSTDIIAHTVIEELEKHGVRVPDDVAVTGFNNQLASLTSSSPITTIDLAYFKRGYEAVELLIDRIMERDASASPQHDNSANAHTVPTSLVVRQSCGCFESEILDSENDSQNLDFPVPRANASEIEIRDYLQKSIDSEFSFLGEERKKSLISAVFSDIYYTNTPPHTILTWFRRGISERKYPLYILKIGLNSQNEREIMHEISSLRRIILPLVSENPEISRKIENIFHALRSLANVRDRYEMQADSVESYKSTNLMSLALALSSAENLRQVENILKINLPLLSLTGLILCLAPALCDDLNIVNIEMVFPDSQNEFLEFLPLKVREPALFPKRFFPKKPFSVMLIPLFHAQKYLGYAYIFMNDGNLALYDDLQELLSQNLYRIFVKEGKTEQKSLLIANREELAESVPITPEENPIVHGGKLNAQSIVDYLLDHIDEMCDLDKMSSYFGLSKSYLTRRTKELTGYPTQILHERLKIEQAKNLIKSGKMKMNDIALRLGFSNPNYFSNVFKKVTGMRPTEFAENSQK